MTDMPEKIWAYITGGSNYRHFVQEDPKVMDDHPHYKSVTKYIRADIHDAKVAELEATRDSVISENEQLRTQLEAAEGMAKALEICTHASHAECKHVAAEALSAWQKAKGE